MVAVNKLLISPEHHVGQINFEIIKLTSKAESLAKHRFFLRISFATSVDVFKELKPHEMLSWAIQKDKSISKIYSLYKTKKNFSSFFAVSWRTFFGKVLLKKLEKFMFLCFLAVQRH